MKQKKLKSESIVISNNESTEELFQKIRGWEITSQVEFAILLDKPKRKELFEKILNSVTAEGVRENISLVFKRIEMVAFPIPDYTSSEIEYYQSFFAKDFHKVLHSENFKKHIEDKIRELFFYCNRLTIDLKTKQYDFLEDRERDKSELPEAERYKFYLENILIRLNNPNPQQVEAKTPTAITKALFCNLINEAGIIERGSSEIPQKYCMRICEKFNLKYTDRVRQNFNGNKSQKHYNELVELILPNIDVSTKDKIQKYLDSKNPSKQRLYG